MRITSCPALAVGCRLRPPSCRSHALPAAGADTEVPHPHHPARPAVDEQEGVFSHPRARCSLGQQRPHQEGNVQGLKQPRTSTPKEMR